MPDRNSIRSFFTGVLTFFVLSVVLNLLHADNLITEIIALAATLLIAGLSYMFIRKRNKK